MNKVRKYTRDLCHVVAQVSKPQLNARPYGDPPSLLVSQLSHLPTFSSRYPSISFIQYPSIPLFLFPTDSILFIGPRPPCYRAPATVFPLLPSLCLPWYFYLSIYLFFLHNWHRWLCIRPPTELFLFLPHSRDVPVHGVWGGSRWNTGWTRHSRGLGHGGEHRRELPD